MYLSRKGVLPDDVDMFGMGVSFDDDGEHDDLFSSGDISEEVSEVEEAAEEEDLFADDGSDDLFADDADDEVVEESGDVEVEQEPAVVEEDNDNDDDDDDDDDDIDALFA